MHPTVASQSKISRSDTANIIGRKTGSRTEIQSKITRPDEEKDNPLDPPEYSREDGIGITPIRRRERKKKLQRLEYQRRLNRWTRRYGSLQALQSTFGEGPPWGDLSPQQTRALYHTLLPRSLLALSEMGLMKPEELAPLAYEARIAAKEYARSRCVLTGRAATLLFDQYRSLRDRGQFLSPGSSSSMSWEEIWDKYEGRIVLEECEDQLEGEGGKDKKRRRKKKQNEDNLATRIYMRILEKSCATNQAFDSMFLTEEGSEDGDLDAIASQLDNDVREILLSPKERSKATKKVDKMKKKEQKAIQKKEKKRLKEEEKRERKKRRYTKEVDEDDINNNELRNGVTDLAEEGRDGSTVQGNSQRYEALRILAGTRRRFRQLLGRQG